MTCRSLNRPIDVSGLDPPAKLENGQARRTALRCIDRESRPLR